MLMSDDEQKMIDEVVLFDYEQYKKLLIKIGRPKVTFISTPMYSEMEIFWANKAGGKTVKR